MLYQKRDKRKLKCTFKIKSMLDIIKKKCVKMLNIVSIIDDYTNRLNDISDILNKSKKKIFNRNVLMIDKFFNLFSKKKRKLFLNNSFDCIYSVINNNLTFSNDTTRSIQQITFNIFDFFI